MTWHPEIMIHETTEIPSVAIYGQIQVVDYLNLVLVPMYFSEQIIRPITPRHRVAIVDF